MGGVVILLFKYKALNLMFTGLYLSHVFDKVHTYLKYSLRFSRVNQERRVHLSKREVYPEKAKPWKDFDPFCTFKGFVCNKDCSKEGAIQEFQGKVGELS